MFRAEIGQSERGGRLGRVVSAGACAEAEGGTDTPYASASESSTLAPR
jgi:hypothetical protein